MKHPQLKTPKRVIERRMKLADPVAETPLAKRMLAAIGRDDFQLLRTFQQHFGARLLHYQDADGEVGKQPGWANDAG